MNFLGRQRDVVRERRGGELRSLPKGLAQRLCGSVKGGDLKPGSLKVEMQVYLRSTPGLQVASSELCSVDEDVPSCSSPGYYSVTKDAKDPNCGYLCVRAAHSFN